MHHRSLRAGKTSGPPTDARRAPALTYQDLLKSPFDEQLFDYYGTSQIIRVGLDGATQVIGKRGIHSEISLSPDGKYLLVETIHRPYSYLVSRCRFPYRVEVWNFEGNVVKQIADLPLAENVPVPRGSVPTGPRNFGWRADVGAELYWTEAQDGGDAGRKAEVREKVFTLAAPVDGEPRSLATLGLRFAGVQWANDDLALVSEFWWQTRRRRTWRVRPGSPEADPEPVFDYSTEDRYNNPGTPLMRPNPWGKSVLFTDENGDAVFLRSQGASPEGNRPPCSSRNFRFRSAGIGLQMPPLESCVKLAPTAKLGITTIGLLLEGSQAIPACPG